MGPMADLLYLMSFLTPPAVGAVEAYAPEEEPHVTLLGAFSLPDERLPSLRRRVAALTPWFDPLTLKDRGAAFLGSPEAPIPATLVKGRGSQGDLTALHLTLLEALTAEGGRLMMPEFAGANYNPHISHWQPATPFSVTLSSLTLVHHREGFGRGVRVVAHYPLGDTVALPVAGPHLP